MSGDDSDPDPVKTAPLKNYVKQFSDLRAGADAIAELEAELLFISRILWQEASRRAVEDGYRTVQLEHLEGAYDDLFEPHNLLYDAVREIDEIQGRLEEIRDRSPIYREWTTDDE